MQDWNQFLPQIWNYFNFWLLQSCVSSPGWINILCIQKLSGGIFLRIHSSSCGSMFMPHGSAWLQPRHNLNEWDVSLLENRSSDCLARLPQKKILGFKALLKERHQRKWIIAQNMTALHIPSTVLRLWCNWSWKHWNILYLNIILKSWWPNYPIGKWRFWCKWLQLQCQYPSAEELPLAPLSFKWNPFTDRLLWQH